MLKSSEKQTLTVHNKMELGEDISVEAKGKGRKFVSRFIEPGVAHYEEFGDVLITKETLDRFINTMVGCPVIIQHKDIDDENVDKERVGVISNVWFNEFDGWYYCDGIIWDKQAIDLIKNQEWSVSCTYDFDSDKLEKTHNGKKIDMEFTGGEFLHLALVPNPRYERANIVMNAKEKDDDVEWITVKGNHIPVKKGQSKDEAVKEFINKQQNKSKDGERKEEKTNKKNKEYDLQSTLEMKIDSHYDDDFITKEYVNEMSELLGTKITEDDIWIAMEKSRPNRGSADYDIQKMSKELQKTAKDKKKKEKEYNKQQEENKKQDTLRYDLKSMLKKISPSADYRYDADEKELQVRYLGKWEGDDGSGDYDWQTPTQDTKDKIEEIKKEFKKRFGYELKSSWSEKNWYSFWISENKTNNSKGDLTMSVLNELESFIKGVIKNADDEDKKEEIKNEDKRKLIDEVGGILKGKVDDEIIKTIMKKMEEASYEPSEDKKADNEADKEEKEEKFEEEKKIANKCKNEEKEKEDKEDKVEDEDDEKDEDDEVDKEEVKNKCKNSMKDVKEIIMGGKSKIESDYVSKADRFALGEKY